MLKASKQAKDPIVVDLEAEVSKLTKEKNKLIESIKNNNLELQSLESRIKDQKKISELMSKEDSDFILPELMTKDVIDVIWFIEENVWIDSVKCWTFNLELTKEIVVKRFLHKTTKKILTEKVRIDYSTCNEDESPYEYDRMMNYYTEIKKHIKRSKKQNKFNFNDLIDDGNEALISSSPHKKDEFILEVVEKLKNL